MKADRNSVTRKINIVRGQLEGIQKMIDEDRYCVTIADQILASSALLKKAAQEVLEAHIRSCVRDALQTDDRLMNLMRRLKKRLPYLRR